MAADPEPTLRFGRHRLDLAHQQLWCGDQAVPLRPKAREVLLYLLRRPGKLVPAAELLDAIWPQADVTPKTLTNRIVELRRALGDDPLAPQIIQTVHRRGYRLMAPVLSSEAADGAADRARPAVTVATQAPGAEPAALSAAVVAVLSPVAQRLFVGRATELAALHALLAAAGEGRRQGVLISADPGLGKSALIEAFVAQLDPARVRVGWGPGLEQSGEREAFGPVLALLANLADGRAAETVVPLLRRCAPSWLVQMPWLLDEAEMHDLRRSLIGTGTGRLLRECCALLVALSQQQPLVVVLEDLHWADAATIDLLAFIAQMRTPARLLVLASYQPVEALLREHPITAMARRLQGQGLLTELALRPLAADQVEALVAQRFGSSALARQIAPLAWAQSEGHPLFLSATVEHLVERGCVTLAPDGWQLSTDLAGLNLALPERLRLTIEARFELLTDDERRLLQAASAVGMQFQLPLLEAVLQRGQAELDGACQRLSRRGLFIRALPTVVWPDGTTAAVYAFLHDAYRRALFDGIAPMGRPALHQRIAERLEAGWGDRAAEVASQLAGAYERAGRPEATARVLELAAGVSMRRFAYGEAADAIEASLRQVAQLPESPARAQTEIRLQLSLGNLMLASRGLGHPRALQAYRTAEALALAIDSPRDWLRALMGQCMCCILTGRAQAAQQVAQALVQGAAARRPGLSAVAHTYAGVADLGQGDLLSARDHFEQALALTPEPDVPLLTDVHAMASLHLGRTLAHLGLADAARQRIATALARSRHSGIPFDLIQNLYWAADSHRVQGDRAAAAALFDEVLALADLHELPHYRTVGQIGRLCLADADRRPLAEVQALVQQVRMSGERWGDVPCLILLAETQQAQGDATAALAAVQAGFDSLDAGALHAADLHRLKAELLMAESPGTMSSDRSAAVLACFQAGWDLAQSRQAALQARRCAEGLDRLRQRDRSVSVDLRG